MRVFVAKCPHCGQEVEATVEKLHGPVDCVHCERPFVIEVPKAQVNAVRDIPEEEAARPGRLVQETPERVLVKTHPAMFRAHPFRFLGCLLLLGLGVGGVFYGMTADNPMALWSGAACGVAGLLLLAIWRAVVLATTLTVSDRRTTLRKGLFSRTTSEVEHDDIRNIQMDQSAFERLFHVGDIGISSSGQDDLEVIARSIPHPNTIVRIIRENQS